MSLQADGLPESFFPEEGAQSWIPAKESSSGFGRMARLAGCVSQGLQDFSCAARRGQAQLL